MTPIKTILCFSGVGLSTSFLMSMNCKKALSTLGITGVNVLHNTVDGADAGMANLYICSIDLLPKAESFGPAIGLQNVRSAEEMLNALHDVFHL